MPARPSPGMQVGEQRPKPSPEFLAAQAAHAGSMTKWRLSVPMSKYEALRKMYNDAGVRIYAFKITLNMKMEDASLTTPSRRPKPAVPTSSPWKCPTATRS